MKTMLRGPRSRSGWPAAAVLSVVLVAATQVPTQDPDRPCPVIGDGATRLRDLEAALVAGDAAQAASAAEVLTSRSRAAAASLQPSGDEGVPMVDLAEQVAAEAADAAAHASAGDLPGAGSATARATRSCILCHVQSRTEKAEKQRFPARGNTVWGRVSINDIDGKPREDRSGVVVFLDEVDEAITPNYPLAPARVSQQNRQFRPGVLPIVLGSTIEFPNDDTIFHNAFSLSKAHPFDLGIYPQGEVRAVRPAQLGLVKVYCNIHPDMKCDILVLQNPCFGVTDAEGTYVITGVPDGEYDLRTWHELGGDGGQRIAVSGSTAVRIDHQIAETKKTASHLNKWGKPYRRKY